MTRNHGTQHCGCKVMIPNLGSGEPHSVLAEIISFFNDQGRIILAGNYCHDKCGCLLMRKNSQSIYFYVLLMRSHT